MYNNNDVNNCWYINLVPMTKDLQKVHGVQRVLFWNRVS